MFVILVQYEEKCVHLRLKLYFYKNITIAFYPFQKWLGFNMQKH
jgi:hypothetical protein